MLTDNCAASCRMCVLCVAHMSIIVLLLLLFFMPLSLIITILLSYYLSPIMFESYNSSNKRFYFFCVSLSVDITVK
jgi:hypothetical protein